METEVIIEKKKNNEPIIIEPFNWIVPDCCRLGLPSCKHVAKPEKPKKTNIGL
jgi:hypothetical protein